MMSETETSALVKPGMLQGLRVIEIADEMGEYCGLLLAGLGAEVIKVEPPGGQSTRAIGPFVDDQVDPEKSLHFWAYNRGKKSVVLDIENSESDRRRMDDLLASADIFLDASQQTRRRHADFQPERLRQRWPSLVVARMTPFGDTGPWADYQASDLIHLALGGVMMNCGYDQDPQGNYDLPPIAPQLWHAYHIAAEQMAIGIVAVVLSRLNSGLGQLVSCAVHEAVAKNTELDVMSWVMRRAPLYRQTCRHAVEKPTQMPSISHTKDGRWYIAWGVSAKDRAALIPFLDRYGMRGDLPAPAEGAEQHARNVPGSAASGRDVELTLQAIQKFVRAFRYENMPWRQAQESGLFWAPLRKPHENAEDEHWQARGTFAQVEHPESGRTVTYPVSKWISTETMWQPGRRAPQLNEDAQRVFANLPVKTIRVTSNAAERPVLSALGKPFPLQGVRIFDFSWFLASAGGTRIAAALGADVIKVEWKDHPDTRLAAMAPVGGRAARQAATAPLPGVTDSDMGGQFNNKNPGKRGLSLNIRHPEGLEIAKRLISMSDVVAEGFSPGVLDRAGLGYDVLRGLKEDIIYVQQSGMGAHGKYGRFRTVGPVAAAFAGTAEMSGLPEPAMPAGWGYSYLDWTGAYGFALAILGALYYRSQTGLGQHIDSSQCESGIFMSAVPVLDWSVNNRHWHRFGNRSPFKPAAPHGAFRCQGEDAWLAIACFTDEQWSALTQVADQPGWAMQDRFRTLSSRLQHQDALERLIEGWTQNQDAQALMHKLQLAGVPAGVCQTAQDRCDKDPQLAHLNWLTEVTGTKIGTWPVAELPLKFSDTPCHVGGVTQRGAPCYGEDNEWILGELLGYSSREIVRLAQQNVI